MNQPFLHDASVVVAAPVQCWADRTGEVSGGGAYGVYVADDRVAAGVTHRIRSRALEHVATCEPGGGRASYHWVVRTPELGLDPAVTLTVAREADGDGVSETLTLASAATAPLAFEVQVAVTPDASTMEWVKGGQPPRPLRVDGPAWSWRDADTRAEVEPGTAAVALERGVLTLAWTVTVPPRGTSAVTWRLTAHDTDTPFGAAAVPRLAPPASADPALARLAAKAWADLSGLLMAERAHPGDAFLAAGAPWFFTLFGRDALLSARMLAAHHPTLARGTLRVLARRQGRRTDVRTAEQPGKILHEVRRMPLVLHEVLPDGSEATVTIPPEYYGTIDATCLWILLLGDLFDAGEDVSEFDAALGAALGWLADHADADGDGFLEYRDESGSGLANQGWKDSGDSIRFADGTQAEAPIALAEVQGYAHAAALVGARVASARGDASAAERWRAWAGALAERFRARFWVSDADGRYPALALDAAKRPVDGCASNMGHLLGTGILDAEEAAVIVARLTGPDMFTGYGIRTMSTANGGYWPLSYHVGSVWTHDTALCVDGMLREGFADEAARVARGLLRAASGFDDRLPELFAGHPAPGHGRPGETEVFPPHPYPASCRPQAWAAASAAVILRALG